MITQQLRTYVFATLFTMGMCATQAIAKEDDFAKKLYEPVELTRTIVLPPAPHPNLTEQDKQVVLVARSVLVSFFKSFDNERENPLTYLAPPLKKRFVDREQLYRALGGGPETHFVKFQVDDFAYRKKEREVIFYLEFTFTAYGEDRTRPIAFAMAQTADEWKLSRLGNDVREREFEEQRK